MCLDGTTLAARDVLEAPSRDVEGVANGRVCIPVGGLRVVSHAARSRTSRSSAGETAMRRNTN